MKNSPICINSVICNNIQAPFNQPFDFTITTQANNPLPFPLNWQIIYVPSPQHEHYDQILEQFELSTGQQESLLQFQVQCNAPKYQNIKRQDLTRSITALIISCLYCGQQFVRIGYFIQNQLNRNIAPEQAITMSKKQLASNIKRTIIIDKPRITYFKIQWNKVAHIQPISKNQQNLQLSSITQIKFQNSLQGTQISQQQTSNKTLSHQLQISKDQFGRNKKGKNKIISKRHERIRNSLQ